VDGGATIDWEAQEYDPTSCQAIEPHFSGTATVEGYCCSRIVDVRFPNRDVTFRMVFRTDWNRG
jgi:hypothetical protein